MNDLDMEDIGVSRDRVEEAKVLLDEGLRHIKRIDKKRLRGGVGCVSMIESAEYHIRQAVANLNLVSKRLDKELGALESSYKKKSGGKLGK